MNSTPQTVMIKRDRHSVLQPFQVLAQKLNFDDAEPLKKFKSQLARKIIKYSLSYNFAILI